MKSTSVSRGENTAQNRGESRGEIGGESRVETIAERRERATEMLLRAKKTPVWMLCP
jgi:hypothetical protein